MTLISVVALFTEKYPHQDYTISINDTNLSALLTSPKPYSSVLHPGVWKPRKVLFTVIARGEKLLLRLMFGL